MQLRFLFVAAVVAVALATVEVEAKDSSKHVNKQRNYRNDKNDRPGKGGKGECYAKRAFRSLRKHRGKNRGLFWRKYKRALRHWANRKKSGYVPKSPAEKVMMDSYVEYEQQNPTECQQLVTEAQSLPPYTPEDTQYEQTCTETDTPLPPDQQAPEPEPPAGGY